MINVSIDWDTDTVQMTGHAQAPRTERDSDLVCCAASMLMQTLAASAGRYGTVTARLEPGDAEVRIAPRAGNEKRALAQIQMLADGVILLHRQYPDNIRMTYSSEP